MGAYYTLLVVTVTNAIQTFTHNLSITPASLVARLIAKNGAVLTATAPLLVCAIGTNVCGVASGVGTTQTCDLEVQMIHSIDA
jgi:hypothetical protein